MNYKKIVDKIVSMYKDKYEFVPTVDVQSFALPRNNIIVLDLNMWQNPNVFFIFTILHEIGHCETFEPHQIKPTREFLATQWAIKELNLLKLELSDEHKKAWQDYIDSFANEKNKHKYKLDWKAI